MGSGTSKRMTPTILLGFRPESQHISFFNRKHAPALDSDSSAPKSIEDIEDNKKQQAQAETNEEKSNEQKGERNDDPHGEDGFIQTVDASCKSGLMRFSLAKFPFNINAHHGGCCALLLTSCSYGENVEDTMAAANLLGSGFDCNHRKEKMFYLDTQYYRGLEILQLDFMEDEYGNFITRNMYGSNHMRLLTNDNQYGNLRNGVFVEVKESSLETLLPLNVNGNWKGENGGGLSMVLCSGTDGDKALNAVYMIRSGFKDNQYKAKVVAGEDKFKFELQGECLAVSGPPGSKYALYHNRDNLTSPVQHAFVSQLQTTDRDMSMVLLETVPLHVSVIVLCSNSNGTEDSTASAIYHIAINNGNINSTVELAGVHGISYVKSDLWTFEVKQGHLEVVGPTGPCKYGIMTNILASKTDLEASNKQSSCIATGETTKTLGKVNITNDEVIGEINKMADITLKWNNKIAHTIPGSQMRKENGIYTFVHSWTKEEKAVGLHLVRVYAVRKHIKLGTDVYLELSGSPQFLTYQKPGVVYAVNAGSQAYQAVNDVVYSSEFSQYANYDYSFNKGFSWRCLGTLKVNTNLPASMNRTDDGFLYTKVRMSHSECDDLLLIQYKVKDLSDGEYIFRLHTNKSVRTMECNGVSIANKINFHEQQESDGNYYCHTADIDVIVKNGTFELKAYDPDKVFKNAENICAFALLDKKTYAEKVPTEERKQEELVEKRKIADTVMPFHTAITRKDLTIIGWSPNLLQNGSAESGDLKYWNIGGDFLIAPGGHDTENCIATSSDWCNKYQEVNLTDHFPAEYLDTAPAIQVLEWYREGSKGGGFYSMTVTLLTDDGETIVEYDTGEIGSIYAESKWQEASHIFTDYGPGVRIVGFTSKGKDDKDWPGHFGTKMSGAEVRVKPKTEADNRDKYCDLEVQEMNAEGISKAEKIVSKVMSDNQELLKDFHEDHSLPDHQTNIPTVRARPVFRRRIKRKKREIRVFVSSTFRDFQNEREEIIKKAFREINRLCSSRGIFFTYVDLRWGITSEQTNDGKTIAICLQEIERCRPYFICLLGDRFGWSQRADTKDETLNMTFDYAIENHKKLKWIEDCRFDTSVTQLEVLHGALNSKSDEDLEKCFFYMRESYKEGDLPEDEYKRMASESEWHHERQESLKSRVKNRPGLKIATFKSPSEVAELITKDLQACIDKDFPIGTELTKLEIQREAHLAFASARCRVYIGRQEYFDTINENRSKEINAPFVLMGESGCGKSALVANWVKRIEDAEPETFMFVHFIGSSAESASYIKMLRRLYEELKDSFNLSLQIPTSDAHLINDLSEWLRVAGSRSKIVIVFDALNQLDDGAGQFGNEHDLLWIPHNLPPNVFVLLSTLPGRAMDVCVERGWPSMKVEPLDDSQKDQIITDYLEGIYGKTLTQDQKDMIVNARQTSNALYLKSLLDEVRMYGSFRSLSAKIQDYLTAPSPGDLFAKILERLEGDFENGENARPYFVRDATSAMWCSNRGMSEAELVDFLNVPSAVWSPFYLSLYENLINRDGILNFFHDHLRQAVEKKYLNTDADKKSYYLKLADFFEVREMSDRKVDELPVLLMKAGESDRLKSTISDLDVFCRMAQDAEGHFELAKAWRSLGDFNQLVDAYKQEIGNVSEQVIMGRQGFYIKAFGLLGHFFKTLGLMEAARETYLALLKYLETFYKVSHSSIVYSAHNHSWRYKCKHVYVIKAMDVCVERGWPSMKVEPLDDSQKDQIITDYLEGIYGKTLTQDQKDMIVNARQTSNALYLKSLLDEVRMYGSFRSLSAKIQDYLTAPSPGDLFAKILERLEGDFENGENARPYLVRDATSAMWCSNRGMSEAELVDFLNVPSAVWSPFYLSLYENLINRDGILNFFHDHLRQAVEKKYLNTDADKKSYYLKLADFFEVREMSDRKVDELPVLLMKAGESDRLKSTISDLDVFCRMAQDAEGHFELAKAWRSLGDFNQLVDAYKQEIGNVSEQVIMGRQGFYIKAFGLLGHFFKTLGLMEAARETYLALLKYLETFYKVSHSSIVYSAHNHSWRYKCKHVYVIKLLKELGSVHCQLGEYEKAVEYYEDAINRVTKWDEVDTHVNRLQLCEGLLGLASVYVEQGKVAAAKPLTTRALEIASDIVGTDHPYTAAIFTEMGKLLYKEGHPEQALAYYMQDLKATRSEVGTNHPRIANVLNEIALVYDDWNDERAGELYETALAIIANIYGSNYFVTAIIRYNLGAFYLGANYVTKAKCQFQEAYRIFESVLGDTHPDTIMTKQALESVN